MRVNGTYYKTVSMQGRSVLLIEQNLLPFEFRVHEAKTYLDTCNAIKTMIVRGAGAIGAAAGFAMAQAFLEAEGNRDYIERAKIDIETTRPTAQNLFYATNRVYQAASMVWGKSSVEAGETAVAEAKRIAYEDSENCRKIGEFGNELIKDGTNIETHCNAGWLAFTDYGTALSPIYEACRKEKEVFVYVNETRPRSQGARLTAWELRNAEIPHAIIPDSAGAHFMSQKKIDIIIVGADRIARNGDTANKIGTLQSAIAAWTYDVPFYIAAPTSTFDLNCESGEAIPIEARSEEEVLFQTGITAEGRLERILVCSPGSQAINPAFDATPAKYIAGIITERGIIRPNEHEIRKLLSR